jgi:hypothetical protein
MSDDLIQPSDLLFQEVRELIDTAKHRAAVAINAEITLLYWQVGNRIHTEILQGQRAEYGKQIVVSLSKRLTQAYGRGWSERQLNYCILIAEIFPEREILHTLSAELSWSHLKLGNFHPEYKGQMELYLRWLAKYDRESDELPPLGIIPL